MVQPDNDERTVRLEERYAEIFRPELGTIKGVTAKLHKISKTPSALRISPHGGEGAEKDGR